MTVGLHGNATTYLCNMAQIDSRLFGAEFLAWCDSRKEKTPKTDGRSAVSCMRSGALSNNMTIRGVSPSGFRAKFDERLASDGQAPIATISISKGAVVVKIFPH